MAVDLSKFENITVSAHVRELEDSTELIPSAEAMLKACSTAAPSPIGENGKPRMLHLTAWICHAGYPNKNGQGFTEADLQEAVADSLFLPPYFGMIDYNHDFTAVGMWYKASYAYDETAQAWGIIAEGAIFAWRYEELADKLMANMARDGFIDVSMACMPEFKEPATSADGNKYELLRKPVFFTTSVLTVPPADPQAAGVCSEDPSQSPEERRRLLAASIQNVQGKREWVFDPSLVAASEAEQEDEMDKEALTAALKEAFGEASAPLIAALNTTLEAASKLPALEAELAAARARVTELEGAVATLTAQSESAQLQADTAAQALTEANAELETLREFKSTTEAAAKAAADEARKTARLAELPEAVRAKLAEKDEPTRTRLEELYASQSDEEWEMTKAALSVGKPSFEQRSKDEGALGGAAGNAPQTKFAIDQFKTNK